MLEKISSINDVINGFIWGTPALFLLIGTGIIVTFITKFFQVSHFSLWWSMTVGKIFKKDENISNRNEKGAISQFQALCTALAATVGTGNIAGVASAIAAGGPGAVFWMWIAAFFGMMTNYAENILGIYYRRKNKQGEWCGGAMYYLQDGLGSYKHCKTLGKVLAVLFSIFALFASFGIGNLAQANTITTNLNHAFGINTYIIGVFLTLMGALVIVGGLKRIARVTEFFVPFMVVLYIVGTLIILVINISRIGEIFSAIFSFAFGFKAVTGAAVGIAVKTAVTMGFKRGVFSNEAGLGSSVMVHSASNVKEPVMQGMWGIFEVFADTIIVCTLTAFTVLSSGLVNLVTGEMLTESIKTALVTEAFSNIFGHAGGWFVAIAILLFAFSTILGWSYYGTKAWEYLFGTKSTIYYRLFFVLIIFVSAVLPEKMVDLPWNLSDTFNGLMMLPNLIGVLALTPLVYKLTKNYIDRKIRNKRNVVPMLSAFEDIQTEQLEKLEKYGD